MGATWAWAIRPPRQSAATTSARAVLREKIDIRVTAKCSENYTVRMPKMPVRCSIRVSGEACPSGSIRQSGCDDIRTLFRDHDGGGMDIRRWHRRHDGGVHDPQGVDAANPQLTVDHRAVVLAHPAGAAGMKHGRADLADVVLDLLVALYVRSGPHLFGDQRTERIGRRDPVR